MNFPPHMSRIGASAALVSALLVGGTISATTSQAAPVTSYATTAHVSAASVGSICYGKLPSQAHDTLDLITAGGPYPYDQDGTVFTNREGVLPQQSDNSYYHEYTVVTPGSPDRGARRIVTGEKSKEDYYTSDHYATFDLVDFSC
ncbi:ribonuclease domain-containing protein [Streptomyces sp. NPDC048664]|uniref:ribonuclease domain-containing protein n=1 Tax=Streptomyces sp. NPDC048664 TaxID=3154505 RepID=UPI003445EF38